VRIIAPDLLIPVSPIQEKPNVKTLFKTPVLQAGTHRGLPRLLGNDYLVSDYAA
jgi:hypothetical protein